MEKETISRISGGMKMRDLVFIDTETTGLDPHIHEVIEIAVIRVKQDWVVGKSPVFTILNEWSAKIKPEHLDVADSKAFLVNGYTPDLWNNAISAKEAFEQLSQKTEDAIMVAHNVAFDAGFIDKYFSLFGIKNKMHYSRLDTISMAYVYFGNNSDINGYSLPELCNYLKIPNEGAHSALPDARMDFELFKKIMTYEKK